MTIVGTTGKGVKDFRTVIARSDILPFFLLSFYFTCVNDDHGLGSAVCKTSADFLI